VLENVTTLHRCFDNFTGCQLSIGSSTRWPMAILTFKAITTDKPGYLSELISFDQPARQLRSSAHRRLTVTKCRTNFGSRAFYHASPAVWNGLPSVITSNLSTLDAFKRAIKLICLNSHSTHDRVTCRACDSHSLRYVTYGAIPADYYYYYY